MIPLRLRRGLARFGLVRFEVLGFWGLPFVEVGDWLVVWLVGWLVWWVGWWVGGGDGAGCGKEVVLLAVLVEVRWPWSAGRGLWSLVCGLWFVGGGRMD